MTKIQKYVLIVIFAMMIVLIPNISNAAVEADRSSFTISGNMTFDLTGLTLDTTHEYEFGITKTTAATVEDWYPITAYTATTAEINFSTETREIQEIVETVDSIYLTIKDKTADVVVLQPYMLDVKIPYLQLTNMPLIGDGEEFDYLTKNIEFNSSLNHDEAYYIYEKITDQNVIDEYMSIKESNGNVLDLESKLDTTAPTSGWVKWTHFNDMYQYGYPQNTINTPGEGLYYMWIYVTGSGVKDIYGYCLVDNLTEEIKLQDIDILSTETVEIGATVTLNPSFTPSNTTEKIVTWKSSDESVATVNNTGEVTGISVGSAVITVTSEDGTISDSCTVTVTEATTGTTHPDPDANNGDETTAPGELPETGFGVQIAIATVVLGIIGIGIYSRFKYNDLRQVK